MSQVEQLALTFPTCVLPACASPVDEAGQACPGCVEAFGPWLRVVEGPVMTPEEINARDEAIRAAVRAQVVRIVAPDPECRQNQTCWLCEERRTCTRTASGWECDTCGEVR